MARKHISIRISEDADQRIQDLAALHEVPYTLVMRAALSVAFTHPRELEKVLDAAGKAQ